MLLVYTHKIAPRLKYSFRQIFIRILGIPVEFTTTIEDFIAHDSLKMSYTKQPLSNEIFVRSHDILFEQGVSDVEIHVQDWEETKCFFYAGEKSAIPFDIFSATFYLLSRYEEYLPHVKDEFGRFTAPESLAFEHGFLHQPVVDIWAYKFRKVFQKNYPNFQFPERSYSIKPIIDVPSPYNFKFKGIMRTLGGTAKDIFNLNFKKLYYRYMILFGLKRDTYDTFKYIINKQKHTNTKFLFFFLIGDYSTYDKGVSPLKKGYITLIKQVADYCQVGLKASFFALEDFATLKREKKRMESIINNSLVNEGCTIKGEINNSIIFSEVQVEEGAVINNSIVMGKTVIKKDAHLENAIVLEGLTVDEGEEIGKVGEEIYLLSDEGILIE